MRTAQVARGALAAGLVITCLGVFRGTADLLDAFAVTLLLGTLLLGTLWCPVQQSFLLLCCGLAAVLRRPRAGRAGE